MVTLVNSTQYIAEFYAHFRSGVIRWSEMGGSPLNSQWWTMMYHHAQVSSVSQVTSSEDRFGGSKHCGKDGAYSIQRLLRQVKTTPKK